MSWAEQSMYPEANENVGADGNTIIADIQGELSKLDIILRPEQTVAHADSHVEDKPQKSLGAKVLARCASGGRRKGPLLHVYLEGALQHQPPQHEKELPPAAGPEQNWHNYKAEVPIQGAGDAAAF